MIITSLPFAAFVLLTLAAYFLLPRRAQLWVLLAASYAFYASWSWHFPLVLAATTIVNDRVLRRVGPGRGRAWVWAGIGFNVAALGLLKYSGLHVLDALRSLGAPGAAPGAIAEVLLPIGFSYRVLENISLLLDAARGQIDSPPSPLEYAVFMAYFPKLLSGPIERARDLVAQLRRERVVDDEAVARGATLIAVGAFRKLVLADSLRALMPPALFTHPSTYAGPSLLCWLLVDVFVVYNDFAGYTDMVRGVSSLFGIELSRNFFCPFFARNFTELWTRWHMTLSRWLRDYVYMPWSRALLRRSARPVTIVNLLLPPLAAMLVSALWHGAELHLLAWGALWGSFLVLGRLPTLWGPVIPPDRQPLRSRVLGAARVWLMLAVSTLVFQMDLPVAGEYLRAAFAGRGPAWPVLPVLPLIAVSLAMDAAQYRANDEAAFRRWPLPARAGALALVVLAVFLITRFKVAEPFIYQGF